MQVFTYNFPDPGVKLIDGTYYAFGTNGDFTIPAATSTDLVRALFTAPKLCPCRLQLPP